VSLALAGSSGCRERRGVERTRICGVVVCGGASSRMGSDKARLDLSGRGLLERAVAQLDGVAGRVVLACGPRERYGDLGLERVLDAGEGGGPIAGIVAALAAVQAEWFCVVACDMPRLAPVILERLLARAEADGLDCCLFESRRGVEPLCAVYHRRCLEPMRAALAAGRRRVVAFLEFSHPDGSTVRVGHLQEAQLEDDLRARDCAHNLNTPSDLERERERREGERGS